MGDTNNTKAIIRAAAKRKAKGTNSTPRHRAEATAPTTTITNPTRIAGIKMAVRNKAVDFLANKSEKIVAHLEVACGLKERGKLLALTEKEQIAVSKAFTFGYNSIPDAARIEGGMPGTALLIIETMKPRKKLIPARGPQISSFRRVVPTPTSSPRVEIVEALTTKLVRTLPAERDLSGFKSVSTASRRQTVV